MEARGILHQDNGIVSTKVPEERLADLELQVFARFVSSKGSVLDLGCGRGRAYRYFALAGFDTIGVDVDLQTLRGASRSSAAYKSGGGFVLSDGRGLCFRDSCFDYVLSLASTLSEKHRLWMSRADRLSLIREAIRVVKPGGLLIVSFVHRYWSLKGFVSFFRNYWMSIREKVTGKKTELGDYVETIGRTRVRFHAFTIREAKSLFPRKGLNLDVWRRGAGPFTDWFFIIASKTN